MSTIPAHASSRAIKTSFTAPLLVFILLTGGIILSSWFFYNQREQAIKSTLVEELTAIADLKVEQITMWRNERLADAEVAQTVRLYTECLDNAAKSGLTKTQRDLLLERLSITGKAYGYHSVALYDRNAAPVLSAPGDAGVLCGNPVNRGIFDRAIAAGAVAMTDLHRHGDNRRPHLTVIAPVNDNGNSFSGAVVFEIDPDDYLYRLVQTWPTPSKSAEVLLVRKEGDSVLYLNELRHKKNTALTLRMAMRNTLPAALAVKGHRGLVEGNDYRNVPVIAVTREIPGTTWRLVAKLDKKEAFAESRRTFVRMAILTLLLIMIAGGIFALLQRRRTSRIYKKLYLAEHEKNDLTVSLAASEERFFRLFSSMTEGVALHEVIFDTNGKPDDYRIVTVNPAYEKHTGLKVEKAAGMLASELYGSNIPPFLREYATVAITGQPYFFETYFPPLNKHFSISVFSPEKNKFATVFEDITNRKIFEKERESTIELLKLLNAKNNSHDLMKAVMKFLQSWSGCEAIGIRLKDGDDYPYYETRGLPAEFVTLESSLCAKDPEGRVIRNDIGDPVIECMCGNVICGRFDASRPFFTKKGSFWSNNTTMLLASTTDADRRARTRNRCNGEGYESVALIRLQFGETPLGLIQINDKRPDRFTLAFIEQVEQFADSISIALEQRRTRAHLSEERERLLVTLRSIGDGVIATDTRGCITLMNHVAETLTGWTLNDADGRPLSEVFCIVNEHTRAPCENPVEKALATGGVVGLANHTALIARDGAERSIADSGAPIRDSAGKVIGVVLVFRDVTENKKAEERLRESEERFRKVFEEGRIGIVIANRSFHFERVNSAFCDMVEYHEDELLRLSFKDITHPDHLALDLEHVTALKQGLIPVYKTDKRYLCKSGRSVWGAATISAIRNIDGEFLYFIAMIQDISDRKKAEDDLIAEKERLAVTLRSIGDAVIATDIHGLIVLMNNVAETLTGWQLYEAQGKPLTEIFVIIDELTRQPCDNPVEKVLKNGTIVTLESPTLLIARDGREVIIADSSAPIRDRESATVGVVLVFRDDSEKQRAREAMRKSEQLESLGVLAGGIAHDFNNLLGGLFGYLDLARESIRSDHDAARNLDKAFSVFGRAKDLTAQLLTFAKGGAPARKTKSLPPLINDTVRFALSGSVVKAIFQIDPNLKPCDIDENQMSQVLDNITINARDAMPRGGAITVSAVNLPADTPLPLPLKPGPYVRISISDQGTGIAPDHLPHIFDPFFTTKQKGSGLGLAVCYSIVKRHEGSIEVESELGRGSTFHVYLPVSGKTATVEHAGNVSYIHKGTGKVLVMDDEDYIRDIATSMLSAMGYDPASASCGEEAIEMFAEAKKLDNPYCLVILDLTVPGGMGGKETKDCIRKLSNQVKIVASSGYSDDPVIAKPDEHGFDASVMKPYKKTELAETVAMVMRGKKTQALKG